jgi:hypothetical protein
MGLTFIAIAVIALLGALIMLLTLPLFKPRGRLTKIRSGYRITPEIEKARQIDKTRVDKLKDERG